MEERKQLAAAFIESTGDNIFLTGRAGTGKTTFLRSLHQYTSKRMVVVAPTGVAALNAGGATIHSFFQLKPQTYLPGITKLEFKASRQKRSLFTSLDLLVIDEVSMVRADLLDSIDATLRYYRGVNRPFGGVQLLLIGDLLQLSPVVADQEWEHLNKFYRTPYFFESLALIESSYQSIELTHIYRQSDSEFIDILNACRDCRYDKVLFDKLNSRYIPNFDTPSGYITLTTHNYKARAINSQKIEQLTTPSYTFTASVSGEFGENIYPCAYELTLKQGAQVMFVKNDSSPQKRYYNGKIGQITDIGDNFIEVECDDDGQVIMVDIEEWQNNRYKVNTQTKELETEQIGAFRQYPLALAWAITIHKSQGLTFDHAVIDASEAFTHGQAYVALSRCRSLEGLVLSGKIGSSTLMNNFTLDEFTRSIEDNHPSNTTLECSQNRYFRDLLSELFDFRIIGSKSAMLGAVLESAAGKLHPDYCKRWSDAKQSIEDDIVKVANRFCAQISSVEKLAQQDELIERSQKGANYFINKIEELILPLIGGWDIELDNAENQKSLDDLYSSFTTLLYAKVELLAVAAAGFAIAAYLDRRAKVGLEKPKFKSVKVKEKSLDIQNPLLFDRLRLWRKGVAMENNSPVYQVASQQALAGISTLLPSTLKELKKVKGVGNKFIERYGATVLAIVEGYCHDRGIQPSLELDDNVAQQPKPAKEKGSSKQLTLEMLQQGKSALEIAAERELTTSTVWGHISQIVAQGSMPATNFMSQELIDQIEEAILANPDASLTQLRESISTPVEFHHIKIVLSSRR